MCHKVVIDMRYVENPYSGLSRFSTNIFYKLLKNGLDKDIFFILLFPPKRISQHLNKFYSIKKSKIKNFCEFKTLAFNRLYFLLCSFMFINLGFFVRSKSFRLSKMGGPVLY